MRYAKPCLLAVPALALALSGCSMMATRPTPAPVSDAGGGSGVKATLRLARSLGRSDTVQISAYRMGPTTTGPMAALAGPRAPIPWSNAPLPGAAPGPLSPRAGPAVTPGTPAAVPGTNTPTTLAVLTAPSYAGVSAPVRALLRQAERQRAAGDLVAAAATLERGLRIEPRNPHLWNRLARVRLEQGQFSQANSLAAKSNTLANNLPALTQDNLRIIALARRKGIP